VNPTERVKIEASVRAYIASQTAQPPRGSDKLDALATRAEEGLQEDLTPALHPINNLLDLPTPSGTPTTYPLSADGEYYKVNVLHRTFFPPRASASYSGGIHQLGYAAPPPVNFRVVAA